MLIYVDPGASLWASQRDFIH